MSYVLYYGLIGIIAFIVCINNEINNYINENDNNILDDISIKQIINVFILFLFLWPWMVFFYIWSKYQ